MKNPTTIKSPPEPDKPPAPGGELKLDPTAACDVCGHFGAFRLEDRTLCPECYQLSGSCCAGCGKEDPDYCD